jgi:hypothetical protein
VHPCTPASPLSSFVFGNWHVVFCRRVITEKTVPKFSCFRRSSILMITAFGRSIRLHNVKPRKLYRCRCSIIHWTPIFKLVVAQRKCWRPAFINRFRKRFMLRESSSKKFSHYSVLVSGSFSLLCYSTGEISSIAYPT